jgi:hypothetical protein
MLLGAAYKIHPSLRLSLIGLALSRVFELRHLYLPLAQMLSPRNAKEETCRLRQLCLIDKNPAIHRHLQD